MAKPVLMIITGQLGSGKTTLARKFAAKLPVPPCLLPRKMATNPAWPKLSDFFLPFRVSE